MWICGDCHAANRGPLANARGRVQIQIRDLDQTAIGNPAQDLGGGRAALICQASPRQNPGAMIGGYEEALKRE
jgi:uncharacterized protein (DUF2252 family)